MEKRIYSCATAHLDTVWNWTFEHTIGDCLYNTLYENFDLFEKYPDYKFNFEGAYRYELFEEYYPKEFSRLKEYVKSGKWNVTGSAYENGDVNVPSPEALFRNILYGNGYFFKKFGKRSKEIYLPDCFGFGYALPSIINHANLLGFTTQKLTWGSAYGTPFDIGRWFGVDGNYCFACLKPDSYSLSYKAVRTKKDNVSKIKENEEKYSLPWTFSFHGVGDQGGAPKESSVRVLQNEINENPNSDIKVLSSRSDQIYDDLNSLTDEQKEKLPTWNNELVMRDHGAGGYTSRAIGKRWNRKGEELCDMTERAAVMGTYFGCMDYPSKTMERAWKRIIAHQFHDDLPGTSVMGAYQRSWNDYVLSLNQLENELEHSYASIVCNMDTSWTRGIAVAVSNNIERKRDGIVKLKVNLKNGKFLKAVDKEGETYPVQVLKRLNDKQAIVAFRCSVPPVGIKIYDLQECKSSSSNAAGVYAAQNSLENERYKVLLNSNGEICSIRDKKLNMELMKKPIRHQLIPYHGSMMWPAWELTHKSVFSKECEYPVLESMHVIYQGAVESAIEVVQTYKNSKFKSVISLSSGSDRVEVQNEVDWWEREILLKDTFVLNVSNKEASYDLGLGVIKRGNNTDKLFEVPAQKWADITEGNFGVSILSDSKYGWDKPDDNTLRMTVLHSPKKNYLLGSMQSHMEVGLNRYGYALLAHTEDIESTQISAKEFNQPLTAFITDSHSGKIKSDYSFLNLSDENVILRAMKKAEDSDDIVVRVNEGAAKDTKNIHLKIGNGIESAKIIYASEEVIGNAQVKDGELVFDLAPYEIKSFLLKLTPNDINTKKLSQEQLKLDYNKVFFTDKNEEAMPVIKDYKLLTIPKSLNPKSILYKGIEFSLDSKKALVCKNQRIALNGKYKKLHMLAFCLGSDKEAVFKLDEKENRRIIHSAFDRIGRWDIYDFKETANIKDCNLAYEFTHAHNENGADVIAKQIYLFEYEFDVQNINNFVLPNDENIVVFALTASKNSFNTELACQLYDRVEKRIFKDNFSFKNKLKSAVSCLPHNTLLAVPINRRKDKYKIK